MSATCPALHPAPDGRKRRHSSDASSGAGERDGTGWKRVPLWIRNSGEGRPI